MDNRLSLNSLFNSAPPGFPLTPYPLQGFYPYPGLPPGIKPPTLPLVSASQTKVVRTTATVPPLSQVPGNSITTVSSNAAMNATRSSSFAAALRKLAKQAGDPPDNVSHESTRDSSPSSSSPRATTPKRGPPPLVYNSTHSSTGSSPPIGTIAPTPSHNTPAGSRKTTDRTQASVAPMIEPIAVKQERDRSSYDRLEDEHPRSSKDSTPSSKSHQSFHATSSAPTVSSHETTRGFQPYHPGDEIQPALSHHYPMDPAVYSYAHSFLPPHAFSQPTYRFEDPALMFERYRMMQPFMSYPHPGLLGAGIPGIMPPSVRYPPEFFQQHPALQMMSPHPSADKKSPAHSAERGKTEEEIRKELELEQEREREREREREKEREREREREQEKEREREREREKLLDLEKARQEHEKLLSMQATNPVSRLDDQGARIGSITQGTPRDYFLNKHWNPLYSPHEAQQYLQRHDDEKQALYHQLHDREVERQILQHNEAMMRERKLLLMERDRMLELEKQEKERSLSALHSSGKNSEQSSHGKPRDSIFHRPYEKNLTNGYEKNHFTDYDRRFMTERLLAEDRSLQRQSVVHNAHHSLKHSSHNSERKQTDKPQEGEGVRLVDNDRLHASHHSNHLNQGEKSHKRDRESHVTRETKDSRTKELRGHERKSEVSYCVSKLDLEERRLQEKRKLSDYNSDESEGSEVEREQESRLHELLMVIEGPPLRLDNSVRKLQFLKRYGLSTHRKRRDIDFRRRRKRRKLYREPSVSPIQLESNDENLSPINLPSRVHSDDLNKEHGFKHKARFLLSLGLDHLLRDKKKELELIRQACDEDRAKRKSSNEFSPNLTPHKQQSSPTVLHSPTQSRHKEPLDVDVSLVKSDSQSISASHFKERRLDFDKASSPVLQRNSPRQSVTANNPRSVIYSENNEKHQTLSQQFAQEFHQSVLQTTRQQLQHETTPKASPKISEEPTPSPKHALLPAVFNRANHDRPRSHHSHNSADESHLRESSRLKWPGIETLMESYHSYSEEQRLERLVLLENCHKLQSQYEELNRTAEGFNVRMSDLYHMKRQQDLDRVRIQSEIDNLKKCLKVCR